MAKLVLLRHGESMWNKKDVFTGWVDVPLSDNGINEALKAGEVIADIKFDVIYVSTLVRALETAMICMAKNATGRTPVIVHREGDKREQWATIYNDELAKTTIPVYQDWHLNERYYGELQGKNKEETRVKFGAEQVHIWRRSYDVPPPNGECLKDTAERTIPFFKATIMPLLQSNKNILIAAHGNSLRSIVMYLDQLTSEQVLKLEIPTGVPVIYDYMDGKLTKK